jgi:hypothetical protein
VPKPDLAPKGPAGWRERKRSVSREADAKRFKSDSGDNRRTSTWMVVGSRPRLQAVR